MDFSPEQIERFELRRRAEQAARQQQQPQEISGRGGFLSSLISEGGAAGGAALGTALLPGVGTVIGGGLGGLFGRLTENKVRDDEFKLGSALGEGALSGVTAGIAPAFRGVKALKAASGAGDDALGAFAKGFGSSPTRGVVAGKLAQGSDDAAIKSFRFSPSQLSKIKKSTGVDAASIIKGEKLVGKTPEQIDEVIFGLNSEFGARVAGITVPKKTLQNNLQKTYTELLNSPNLSLQKAGQQLQQQSDEILRSFGNNIDGKALNTLKGTFDDQTSWAKALADPDNADVARRVGDALRTSIREASGDDALKSLGQRLQRLNELNTAVAKQSNLGRGSQALGLTDLLAGGAGGAGGGALGAGAMIAGKRAVNSPKAQSALSGALGRMSGSVSKIPSTGFTSQLGGQLASRIPGQLAGAGQPQVSSLDASQNTNMINPMNSNMDGTIPQQGGQAQPVDYGQQLQQMQAQAMLEVLEQGGSLSDAQELAEIIPLLFQSAGIDVSTGVAPEELSGEQQKRALTSQSGLRSLDVLDQTLAQNPGAFKTQALPNPFGITAGITGTSEVRSATDNVIDVIARLRSGAAITEDEANRFAAQLPQPGDPPEAAAFKLAQVRAELESFVAPQQASLANQLAQQGVF